MKTKVLVAVMMSFIFSFSLWAFPIYDIGNGFLGLTQSNDKSSNSIQYLQSGSSEEHPVTDKVKNVNEAKAYRTLWQCYDPYYLRCSNDDGSITYWKTSELHTTISDDSWGDAMGSPETNEEYRVIPIFMCKCAGKISNTLC